MKQLVVLVSCVVSLGFGVSVAAGNESSRPSEEAVVQRLSSEAAGALGEKSFACFARVWESPAGHRSPTGHESGKLIGLSLLVAARRALPAARRFGRAHEGILGVGVVDRRYSLASMRRRERLVRDGMSAFPLASVSMESFYARSAPCPYVEIQIDGMPRALTENTPPAPQGQGSAETLAAAKALQIRYGAVEITVLE